MIDVNDPRGASLARPSVLNGVLVIDKPAGPTSHDVVARLRRVLGTRAIGHAGTLDPAASGVLVIAIGQATKLVSYLTAEDKQYRATVTFGRATITLDAEGETVAEGAIPVELASELSFWATGGDHAATPEGYGAVIERALEKERARREQLPPAFSAIKTDGRRAHERARRGEPVPLAPRPVDVRSLEVAGATSTAVHLALVVSKGYYVRSLARDLGETLKVPAHLSSLRRLASGNFTVQEALPLSASHERLCQAVQPMVRAALRVLPASQLSAEGAHRARRGQLLCGEHFVASPPTDVSAWLDPEGELIAVGASSGGGHFAVRRGFVST